ncbi:MAG TPA: hypothetical protein VFV64_07525 [Permianibacter sp.]|nr:hypothetical protein [Permianibacter sp.]
MSNQTHAGAVATLSPATVIVLLQLSTLASALAAYWLFPAAMHGINAIVAELQGARGPGAGTMAVLFLLYWLLGVIWTAPYWLAPVLAFLLPLLCVYPLLRRDPVGVQATLRQFVAPPTTNAASKADAANEQGRHVSAVFFVSLIWPGVFYALTRVMGDGPWLAFSGWWWWLCLCFYLFVLVLLAILTMERLHALADRRARMAAVAAS